MVFDLHFAIIGNVFYGGVSLLIVCRRVGRKLSYVEITGYSRIAIEGENHQ
jgi:hypothetical protein